MKIQKFLKLGHLIGWNKGETLTGVKVTSNSKVKVGPKQRQSGERTAKEKQNTHTRNENPYQKSIHKSDNPYHLTSYMMHHSC